MEFNHLLLLVFIGFAGGVLSGLFGIGGGLVIVPMLVVMAGFSQKSAQGTTLAMLTLPVVFLGAWTYYRSGHAHWSTALVMAVGFILGVYLSAHWVVRIPDSIQLGGWTIHQPLKKSFALLLVLIAIRMFWEKG